MWRYGLRMIYCTVGFIVALTLFKCDDEIASGDGVRELKVLCIGNSFTEDAFSYVPPIFSNVAPDVKLTLAIAYIGGAPLVQHYVNITWEPEEVDGECYTPQTYTLYKCIGGDTRWIPSYNMTMADLLADERWDIITFQQGGAMSYGDYDKYYEPYVALLPSKLRRINSYSVKLGWVVTHGCYSETEEGLRDHWRICADNSRRVMENSGFEIVFPYGTALQNLRDSGIANESEKPGWSYDYGHLQEGLGCLVSAYANTLVLLNEAGAHNASIMHDDFIPSKIYNVFHGTPNPQYGQNGVVGLSESNVMMAKRAAMAAVENPFELSELH